ncbi:hypothetical protein L195_g055478, partial [Trifolium pratense]
SSESSDLNRQLRLFYSYRDYRLLAPSRGGLLFLIKLSFITSSPTIVVGQPLFHGCNMPPLTSPLESRRPPLDPPPPFKAAVSHTRLPYVIFFFCFFM